MSSKFKHTKNNGGLSALAKRVRTPGTVDVGIIDAGEHDSGDLTVAEIGYANEFGTEKIPERSFIRATRQEVRRPLLELQKKLYVKIMNGTMKTETALGILGEFLADKISQKIITIKSPPNAPSTIAKKGSSNPLIATSQLKNSITYEVNR